MARVKPIQTKDDVAPEHHALFDYLAARRNRISGPSSVVMNSPAIARQWNEIGEYLHGESPLPPSVAELAVCATARHHNCAYIWSAHTRQARAAGVGEATIEAVREHAAVDAL